jgi:hypothetical protein
MYVIAIVQARSDDMYSLERRWSSNRINQSNASGLYPAFNRGSCSPRPALSYDPCLPSQTHLAPLRDCHTLWSRFPSGSRSVRIGNSTYAVLQPPPWFRLYSQTTLLVFTAPCRIQAATKDFHPLWFLVKRALLRASLCEPKYYQERFPTTPQSCHRPPVTGGRLERQNNQGSISLLPPPQPRPGVHRLLPMLRRLFRYSWPECS